MNTGHEHSRKKFAAVNRQREKLIQIQTTHAFATYRCHERTNIIADQTALYTLILSQGPVVAIRENESTP